VEGCVFEQDKHTLPNVHPSKQQVNLHVHHRENPEIQKEVKKKVIVVSHPYCQPFRNSSLHDHFLMGTYKFTIPVADLLKLHTSSETSKYFHQTTRRHIEVDRSILIFWFAIYSLLILIHILSFSFSSLSSPGLMVTSDHRHRATR